jgi:uncharacterized membrane protein
MKPELPADTESRMESAISYLMITGVIISLLLEISGMVLYFIQNGNLQISQTSGVFIHGKDFFSFIYQVLSGKNRNGAGITLITAGLIVLILTPFLRVVLSVIYFSSEKNMNYVWITLFVLVVITLSLSLH